jgi:hypothetical protein
MKKKTSLTKLKKSKNKKQLTSEEANSIIPPSLVEPKKPRGKEKVHYVNSKEFEEEIQKFYNTEFISIKLGDSINKIAHGLSFVVALKSQDQGPWGRIVAVFAKVDALPSPQSQGPGRYGDHQAGTE